MMEAASPISQVPKTAGDSDSVSTPRPGGGGQWERFEVVLSKPSGRQKLGMVLKHAQVTGFTRTTAFLLVQAIRRFCPHIQTSLYGCIDSACFRVLLACA